MPHRGAPVCLALLLALGLSASVGGQTVSRARLRGERLPIVSLRLFVVSGLELTPLDGPLNLRAGQRVQLAAEARDDRGMAIAFRPHWELDRPRAGLLKVNPYNGVATFVAGRPARCRLIVRDTRVPRVTASARLHVLRPGEAPLPSRLEAYLVQGGRRLPIRQGVALFVRPGRRFRVLVLGVSEGQRRPERVVWSLDPTAGSVVRLGPGAARVQAGHSESPPKRPHVLQVRSARDPRIALRLPLVVER